ncbi:hypothetical protein AB0M20_40780 [Actinoplanes sp. NPDC051633]|uniref:hypothetical protein n=1 Tax=Actinoplanes sp. NPDC051633 TaxID=3155670 RepID=UPI00344AAF2A
MLSGYFAAEMAGERPIMRSSLLNGGPEGVERLRGEFRDFLINRPMTRDEFYKATSAWFDSDEQLYAAIGDAHRFFFDEEPPPPKPFLPTTGWTER